jgi:MurNAc alpha-1-phosphate uridylyltransferase
MVLAAGLGTRLRPLTDTRPKPLVEVAGRTLIDRVLDRLIEAGVATAVINTHYRAAMLERHLAHRDRPHIRFSREAKLLDTGGGVRQALPLLGPGPFFTINSDALWTDGRIGTLRRLAARWNDDSMDALLLLQPREHAIGYAGSGDFERRPSGRLIRRKTAPLVFAGVQILHPRLFKDTPEGAFSLNLLYDRAQAAGRLYGQAHDGDWYHIGTMEARREAEERLLAEAGTEGVK